MQSRKIFKFNVTNSMQVGFWKTGREQSLQSIIIIHNLSMYDLKRKLLTITYYATII